MFGQGTYFSVDLLYSSQDKYSAPDERGCKAILACKVLTGVHAVGKKGMKQPTIVNPSTNQSERFDSLVDNLPAPSMFVIFHDVAVYPNYITTFRYLITCMFVVYVYFLLYLS